jgi:hypothetical protein
MSRVALTGNPSGTGTFTIASPNSNTDRTLTLPDNSGTVLTSASDIPAANLTGSLPAGMGGKILQVVQTVKTDTASTQSTSFVDVPGMSVSITPTSATSKILVFVNFQSSASGHASARLLRNSTDIAIGDADGSRIRCTFQSQNTITWDVESNSMTFLDSPNTTSATTYKLQWAVPYSAGYIYWINRASSDANATYVGLVVSTITVMEVAA